MSITNQYYFGFEFETTDTFYNTWKYEQQNFQILAYFSEIKNDDDNFIF